LNGVPSGVMELCPDNLCSGMADLFATILPSKSASMPWRGLQADTLP
jgi:hypothetical protein